VDPKKKTIFIVLLAVLDCAFAFSLVYTSLSTKRTDEITIKSSGNMVLLADMFNTKEISKQVQQAKEEKKIKEEEEKKKKLLEEQKKAQQQVQQAKIVYDGMTLNQLAAKLNRSLNSTIKGKGYLIASYSLQRGVDPYIATAIILQETGCKWSCSNLVKKCNNVGGMKGKGCGSYQSFSTIDVGITKFIDNLANNYFSKGLNTPEKMNKKYAESKTWAQKVNAYVKKIKSA
jgi:hypothetical protein